MNRSAAVVRVQEGLGFTGTGATVIVSRLIEAQRELERGKTLPRFLLQENQTLLTVAPASTVALPTGFLRPATKLRYFISGEMKPRFVDWKQDLEAAESAFFTGDAGGPRVALLRKTTIDFINPTDINYTFYWDYYKAGALLTSDVENEWLNEATGAPEWLIGEAGLRMARDKRDPDAVGAFNEMLTKARAAALGEDIAREESTGPIYMGSEL